MCNLELGRRRKKKPCKTSHAKGFFYLFFRLGIFVSILTARHCFQLQAFGMLVVIPSILEFGIWDSSNNPNIGTDSELRARLSVHLLLKLFKTVETFNGWNGGEGREPLYYTMGSPSPMPRPSIHSSGIKLSCDRQLLSAAHKNVQVGAILAGALEV